MKPALGMLLGTVLLLSQAAFPFFGAEARSTEVEVPTSPTTTKSFPASTDRTGNPVEPGPVKVIALVVDALSVADFTSDAWPNVRAAVSSGDGAIGLMNTRTAGPNTAAAAHITIGAGGRARAGSLSGLTFGAAKQYRDEDVTVLYESTTGAQAADASLLFLGLGELRTFAAMPSGPFSPGALGQALADAGLRTALIGNADGHDVFRRHAALIAMDAHGRIPHGAVGRELLANDHDWPFRLRTDYDATWDEFVATYDAADFIVVELGDLARLETYADWVTSERMGLLRRDAVERIDEFVGRLLRWPPAAGQHLLLVSPSPPTAALRRGWLLTPIVWTTLHAAGPALPDDGTAAAPHLISSNTTRRAGVVTNTDVAPTVLGAFGISSAAFSGTSMRAVPPSALGRDVPSVEAGPIDPWTAVQLLYDRVTLMNSLRAPVVQSFIGFSIAVFVAWVAWMTYAALGGSSGPEVWSGLWRWILLFLTAIPAAILVLPLTNPRNGTVAMITLVLISAALTTVAHVFRRRHVTDAFIAIALVTAAILVTDVWLGARLVKNSILGYDPIVAARFYGIGNEYMGVLIGTALIGTTGLLDAWTQSSRRASGKLRATESGATPSIESTVTQPERERGYPGRGRPGRGGPGIGRPRIGRLGIGPFAWLRSGRGRSGRGRSGRGGSGTGAAWGPLALAAIVYAAIVFVLASPSLGANVGGTIAAVIGFGVTLVLLIGRRPSWKTAVGLATAVAAVLLVAALIDATVNREQPSHLGRALMAVVNDGWAPLATIVSRKLAMNLRLLRWTIWAQVFVVSLAITGFALYRPGLAVRRADQRHPNLLKGIRGAVIAALAALIANDSGVVAAATLMIPVTAILMYVMLLQRTDPSNKSPDGPSNQTSTTMDPTIQRSIEQALEQAMEPTIDPTIEPTKSLSPTPSSAPPPPSRGLRNRAAAPR